MTLDPTRWRGSTPEPWNRSKSAPLIWDRDGRMIANADLAQRRWEEKMANAALIADAPVLAAEWERQRAAALSIRSRVYALHPEQPESDEARRLWDALLADLDRECAAADQAPPAAGEVATANDWECVG